MKTITVGQLRQNPTPMLDDVEAGEVYVITRHGREIARIVPRDPLIALIPPKRPGGTRLPAVEGHVVRSAASLDALLEDERADRA